MQGILTRHGGALAPRRFPRLYVPRAGDGCVLWLPGQDDAFGLTIRDRSGNNNHGTITGATWTRLPSGLRCLSFDGNDYVEMASSPALNFTSGDFSIIVWIYLDSLTIHRRLFSRGVYGGAGDGYLFSVNNNGVLEFQSYQASAGVQTSQSAASQITTGSWYTVGLSRVGASVKLFKNGVNITSVAGTHVDPATCARTAKIGIYDDKTNNPWVGKIALVRIYNRALSAAQVASIYQQERHLFKV